MKPVFFATSEEFRAWLEANHATASEVIVGFHRVGSGKPSMRWPDAVDEALCFGWIDGVRHRLDDTSYTNRFTPRKPRSNWSAVNIAKVERLIGEGRMHPAGMRAFEARTEDRSAIYSYEQRHLAKLEPALEKRFRARKRAWAWFREQPPGYRKTAIYWVASAKRPETRERRFAQLVEDSAAGRRIGSLVSPSRRSPSPSEHGGDARR
jgi:uncharacterized protein YdeI (YjbR/CyaY-like superfamily)